MDFESLDKIIAKGIYSIDQTILIYGFITVEQVKDINSIMIDDIKSFVGQSLLDPIDYAPFIAMLASLVAATSIEKHVANFELVNHKTAMEKPNEHRNKTKN